MNKYCNNCFYWVNRKEENPNKSNCENCISNPYNIYEGVVLKCRDDKELKLAEKFFIDRGIPVGINKFIDMYPCYIGIDEHQVKSRFSFTTFKVFYNKNIILGESNYKNEFVTWAGYRCMTIDEYLSTTVKSEKEILRDNRFILVNNADDLHKAKLWFKNNWNDDINADSDWGIKFKMPFYYGCYNGKFCIRYEKDLYKEIYEEKNKISLFKLIDNKVNPPINEIHLKEITTNTNLSVVGYIAGYHIAGENNISCYTKNNSESPYEKWDKYFVKVRNKEEYLTILNWWNKQGVVIVNSIFLYPSEYPAYIGVNNYSFIANLTEEGFKQIKSPVLIRQIQDDKTGEVIYTSLNKEDSKKETKTEIPNMGGFHCDMNLTGYVTNTGHVTGNQNTYVSPGNFYTMSTEEKLNYLYKLILNK